MGLLIPAHNTSAFLKCGILGFQGSGKTRTATEIAIGITKLTKGKKCAMMDTESGSDYMIPIFKKNSIDLFVHKGRAFKDAVDIISESEKAGFSVLILDSVSLIWTELMESYTKKLNRKNGLYFQDWAALKSEWRQLTDAFLNSNIHIIMCGRAAWEYEMDKNEDTGRNELLKSGTKMKAESEFGYEPSLLLEMERIPKPIQPGAKSKKKTSGWINRCTILKDRTDLMNGKQFDYPTFKNFTPIIDFLNLGGEHIGVDTKRNSQEIFDSPDRSWTVEQKQRQIAIEELDSVLTKAGLGGTGKEEKLKRVQMLEKCFGTSAKTAIENMDSDEIRFSTNKLMIETGLKKEDPLPPILNPNEQVPMFNETGAF